MKCQVCGVEIEGGCAPAGMCVVTNAKPGIAIKGWGDVAVINDAPDEDFTAIFGFWNQRTRAFFEICGACLGEKLSESLCQITTIRRNGE